MIKIAFGTQCFVFVSCPFEKFEYSQTIHWFTRQLLAKQILILIKFEKVNIFFKNRYFFNIMDFY